MIVRDNFVVSSQKFLVDVEHNDTDLLIHCGTDGMFVGKVFVDKKLVFSTDKKVMFKNALYDVMEWITEQEEKKNEYI